MALAIAIFAIVHPGRTLTGADSEFSKLLVEKGARRWWCCGRRKRTKKDVDFEMHDLGADGADVESDGTRNRRESDRQQLRSHGGRV